MRDGHALGAVRYGGGELRSALPFHDLIGDAAAHLVDVDFIPAGPLPCVCSVQVAIAFSRKLALKLSSKGEPSPQAVRVIGMERESPSLLFACGAVILLYPVPKLDVVILASQDYLRRSRILCFN